jgi:hypothetical protein
MSATRSCFLSLERYFHWQIDPRKLHFVPAVQSRSRTFDCPVRGLYTKVATLVDKSRTANRKGSRPAIVSHWLRSCPLQQWNQMATISGFLYAEL